MFLGREGEKLAARFLKKKQYQIAERNYNCPLGEIDLIAEQDETVVFVEVKTRADESFGQPFEWVTATKQQRLRRLAEYYLKTRKEQNLDVRFDVISIVLNEQDKEINHIKGAF